MGNSLNGLVMETHGQFYISSLPRPSPNFHRTGNDSSINVLPDDVLLEVFDFCRLNSDLAWNHKGWYKLAHTCRQWRHIVFSSPSRLDLQLYCTYGAPVANMLGHSPQLHLIVDYGGRRPLPAKDEEGALLALQKHDRIRYIDIYAPSDSAEKLFAVMNGTFPVLEHLMLRVEYSDIDDDDDESEGNETYCPRLPSTFQAPRLQYLDLNRVGNLGEAGLPLLASLSGLVSLTLIGIPVSFYLPLEYLASRLSLMPQLECLDLEFNYYVPSDEIGRELANVKRISLPSLSQIFFKGDSSYLEGIAARITAPLLTKFSATFLTEPSSTLLHLSGLLSSALELRLPVASIKFSGTRVDDPNVAICVASSEQTLDRWPHFAPFHIVFYCEALNVQVASAERICSALTPMLSVVEKLHLDLDGGRWQLGDEGDIEDATWLNLLRPFRKVEKLQVDVGLIDDLSLALCSNDNGPTTFIVPELRKLTRPDYACFGEAFDKFIATRREAGRHIAKRRRPPIPNSDSEEEGDDDDGSDLEEDEDGSNSEEDEEEDEEDEEQEEPEVELGVEDEREEVDPNTDTDADPDYGSDDDLDISTELDSDSDLDSEY